MEGDQQPLWLASPLHNGLRRWDESSLWDWSRGFGKRGCDVSKSVTGELSSLIYREWRGLEVIFAVKAQFGDRFEKGVRLWQT